MTTSRFEKPPAVFAASRSATAEHAQISSCRFKSRSDPRPSSHHAARTSPASPPANLPRRSPSDQTSNSPRPNLHSAPHRLRAHSRGFLPWRLSDAGPRARGSVRHGAGIRNPSQSRRPSASAACPVYPPTPDERGRRWQGCLVPRAEVTSLHR
jgi:hypothetical protein